PLNAPIIRAELRQVEERSRAQLAPRGVELMAVVGADDALLLEWNSAANGAGTLTPAQSLAALSAAGSPPDPAAGTVATDESIGESLAASFDTLLAMIGLGSEEEVLATSAIRRNGQPVGAVVVGLDRS